MKVSFSAVLAFALVAGVSTSTSFAQSGPGGPGGQGQGGQAGQGGQNGAGGQRGGGMRAPVQQQIDLATAKKLIAGAEAAAIAKNDHLAVTVMDARGDMVAFERMDQSGANSVTSSQGKAHAVLLFGLPTSEIADAVDNGKPITARVKLPMAGAENIYFLPGGLPIIKDGKMIGSIACGGSTTDTDVPICQAALDAVFPKQ